MIPLLSVQGNRQVPCELFALLFRPDSRPTSQSRRPVEIAYIGKHKKTQVLRSGRRFCRPNPVSGKALIHTDSPSSPCPALVAVNCAARSVRKALTFGEPAVFSPL